MVVEKSKKNKWVTTSTIVGLIISIITIVWLFEDRYFTVAKAQEMKIRLVQSLQQFQTRQDSILLDDLYRRKALYGQLIKRFPFDQDLKQEYDSINREIEILRNNIIKRKNHT